MEACTPGGSSRPAAARGSARATATHSSERPSAAGRPTGAPPARRRRLLATIAGAGTALAVASTRHVVTISRRGHMRRGPMAALMVAGALALSAAPASGASKNVELLDNLPEAKNATAINFLRYTNAGQGNGAANGRQARDVMLVTGRFGLKSYSLADPAHPRLLDEVTAEELRLPGDPAVRYGADGTPISTFWQNED